jgi:pimeloyl-ACP methyl ester carboxylesterase
VATIETIEIPARGFTFDALRAGPADGEPVLLLHGFPQTGYCYRHQVEALADAGFQAVAPDQRGYSEGARPPEVEDYRLDLLVDDVLAMADQLGFERFHLVGHDWGAMVAWVTAGKHQDRVISLTTLSVPHPYAFAEAMATPPEDGQPPQRERSSYVDVFKAEGSEDLFLQDDAANLRRTFTGGGDLMPLGNLGDEVADVYIATLTQPGAMRAALNWYRAMTPESLAGFGDITMPTLHVWSTEDPALGREGADATGKYVAGPYRFEVLEGVSHWIQEEAPEVFSPMLVEHVRSASER